MRFCKRSHTFLQTPAAASSRNQRFNFVQSFAHLTLQRCPFLFAHSFQLGQGVIERTFDAFYHRVVESVARWLQGAGQARHNVDINFTGNLEFLLHLAQRADRAGDQRSISS